MKSLESFLNEIEELYIYIYIMLNEEGKNKGRHVK